MSRCHYYPSLTASTAAAIAASATLSSDLALCRTLSRKNAEIEDLSFKFKKEVSQLEIELTSTKQTNDELKAALVFTGWKFLELKFFYVLFFKS